MMITEKDIIENLKRADEGKPLTIPLAVLNGEFKKRWFGDKEYQRKCQREYNQRPEVKKYHREYNKEYYQRPEVKKHKREYYQRKLKEKRT